MRDVTRGTLANGALDAWGVAAFLLVSTLVSLALAFWGA
jgi:hypothetical protein